MPATWFPRPAEVSDVELVESTGELDAEAVFRLLVSPEAREWPHKVGVAGKADGSGKPSTRLLASSGWVLKTQLAMLEGSREPVLVRVRAMMERGARAGAWHPSKQWALVRVPSGWLPLSACRELSTLRDLDPFEARASAWTRLLAMGIDVGRRSGLGLDLNPANFASERSDTSLFYVDDEFYPTFDLRQIGYTIAARIPEEPDALLEKWRAWGRELRSLFVDRRFSLTERGLVTDALLEYPLASQFDEARAALVGPLRSDRATIPARPREVVCVLADVHANLPALRAVVAAARERRATRFLFLGDAVGYGPHPDACVELLAGLEDVRGIRGNHDDAIVRGRFDRGMNGLARASAAWTHANLSVSALRWLDELPKEQIEDDWMAVHGAPRDPNRFLAYVYDLTFEDNLKYLGEQKTQLCFHGHTHVGLAHVMLPAGPTKLVGARELEVEARRPCLVNPGSVGQPRDGDPRAAFALWDRHARRITFERVAYDVEQTVRDIERVGLPVELASRLRRGT